MTASLHAPHHRVRVEVHADHDGPYWTAFCEACDRPVLQPWWHPSTHAGQLADVHSAATEHVKTHRALRRWTA